MSDNKRKCSLKNVVSRWLNMATGSGIVEYVRVYNKRWGIKVTAKLKNLRQEVLLFEYHCGQFSFGGTVRLVKEIYNRWCAGCWIPYGEIIRGKRKVRFIDPSQIPPEFKLESPGYNEFSKLHASRNWQPHAP